MSPLDSGNPARKKWVLPSVAFLPHPASEARRASVFPVMEGVDVQSSEATKVLRTVWSRFPTCKVNRDSKHCLDQDVTHSSTEVCSFLPANDPQIWVGL